MFQQCKTDFRCFSFVFVANIYSLRALCRDRRWLDHRLGVFSSIPGVVLPSICESYARQFSCVQKPFWWRIYDVRASSFHRVHLSGECLYPLHFHVYTAEVPIDGDTSLRHNIFSSAPQSKFQPIPYI